MSEQKQRRGLMHIDANYVREKTENVLQRIEYRIMRKYLAAIDKEAGIGRFQLTMDCDSHVDFVVAKLTKLGFGCQLSADKSRMNVSWH